MENEPQHAREGGAHRAAPLRSRSTARALASAVVAAILYGSWAGFSNWEHGTRVALEAGLVQGAMSFLSTLTLVLVLEALFRLGVRLGGRAFHGFLLAAVGTTSLMSAVMTTVHWVAGTPNLVITVAPSLVVGAVFFIAYAWRLLVAARPRTSAKSNHAP
jgi:hypothetical protein